MGGAGLGWEAGGAAEAVYEAEGVGGAGVCVTIASTAGLALSRVIADTIAVNVSSAKSVGASCTLAEAGGRGEGLVLTNLKFARDEVVEISREGASGEEGDGEGMHLYRSCFLWIIGYEASVLGSECIDVY